MIPETRFRSIPSAIRRAGEQGRAEEQSEVLDLTLGQPSWAFPEAARLALAQVSNTPYTSHLGLAALRQEIVRQEDAGSMDRVLVTTGAQGALHALARAFLGPGDVALVPDPGFPAYAALTRQNGAQPLPYVLHQENGFRLDSEVIAEALRSEPKIRLVFICHPSNPTGAGTSNEALRRTAELCASHGALLVADETYRHLHPPESPTPESLATLTQDLAHAVVVSSVSKAWSAPGLRVGWLIGDPQVIEACRDVHAWATTCAAEPCQHAARALLAASSSVLPQARREWEKRWQAFEQAWTEDGGTSPRRPDGGLYAWFRGSLEASRNPFAFWANIKRRVGVAVVPGLAFGEAGRRWARISLGAQPESISLGVQRLRSLGVLS